MRQLTTRRRRKLAALTLAVGLLATACGEGSSSADESADTSGGSDGSGGTLVIGATFSDIPLLDTGLAANQGWEGYREVSNVLYDPLIRFDLSSADEVPTLIPSLATKWTPNADGSSWIIELREGVTFHDGTDWNADAAIFNLDRSLNKESPDFFPDLNAKQFVLAGQVKAYSKVDDYTIQIDTNGPDALLPNSLTTFYFASPTAVKKLGNDGFGEAPVGTGPFKFESLTPGTELVLTANEDYYDGRPKLDKYILKPLADPTARVAALRSGEVNWIEYPPPDDHAGLEAAGFQVITNDFDHIWPWFLDTTKAPLDDVRVRQALNFAIDREAIADDLLLGTADPLYQYAPKANLAYREENNFYSYDPEKAKQLLADAGYPDGLSITLSYPTSGSGNMIPTPINEKLQSDLAKVGVKVELEPIDWGALLATLGEGKLDNEANAVNASQAFWQESAWALYFSSKSFLNFLYNDPKVDEFLGKAATQLDDDERFQTYADLSAYLNETAPWLVVVSDRNARALAGNVKGYVQPQNWFVDYTTIWIDE